MQHSSYKNTTTTKKHFSSSRKSWPKRDSDSWESLAVNTHLGHATLCECVVGHKIPLSPECHHQWECTEGAFHSSPLLSQSQIQGCKCETACFFLLLQSPDHRTNVPFLPEALLCFPFQDLKHWVHNVLHWQQEPSSLPIYHVLVQMPKEIQIGGGSVDFFLSHLICASD